MSRPSRDSTDLVARYVSKLGSGNTFDGSNRITLLKDISGNSNDITGTTHSPFYFPSPVGPQTIQHLGTGDGSGVWFALPVGIPDAGNYSLFMSFDRQSMKDVCSPFDLGGQLQLISNDDPGGTLGISPSHGAFGTYSTPLRYRSGMNLLAITCTGQTWTFYLNDNAPFSQTDDASRPHTGALSNILIGSNFSSGSRLYPGMWTDFSICKAAYTAGEVAQIFADMQAYSGAAVNPTRRIIAHGDSITYGAGCVDGYNYMRQLFIPNAETFNFSVPGYTLATGGQGSAITNAPTEIDPFIVPDNKVTDVTLIVALSVNDLSDFSGAGFGRTAAQVYADLGTYVTARRAAAVSSGVRLKIYFNMTMPAAILTGPNETQRQDLLALLIASNTFDGLIRLDAVPALSNDANATFFADGTHPTTIGEGVMARTISGAILPQNVPTTGRKFFIILHRKR